MKSPKRIYKFHVANLQEIDYAMGRVASSLRTAISKGDGKTTSSFMRLYALLLGAWAEERLKKLIYEPNGFTKPERDIILVPSTRLEQWQKALELGFRRQYKVPKAHLSESSLSHSAHSRYTTLSTMLEDDLRSVIQLRNKLAHGQWVYPLNSDENDIAQEQMDALRNENLLSLQFKKTLLTSLAAAIHDLVVSRPTFERDFDDHFRAIVETRCNLQKRDYEQYVANMRQKYIRGQEKRRKSTR
jgi:hypothetical protein